MRPSWWITPTICAPGHHISVAGAPVPSTRPFQASMSAFTVTCVREIVTVVSLPRLTLIDAGAPASLVSAYSTTAARGGRNVAMSVAAGEDIARCTIALCSAVMAVPAGAGAKMWFQLAERVVTSTPCEAAALVDCLGVGLRHRPRLGLGQPQGLDDDLARTLPDRLVLRRAGWRKLRHDERMRSSLAWT